MMKEQCIKLFDFLSLFCLCGLIFFIPFSNAGVEICFGLLCVSVVVKNILKPDFSFLKRYSMIFLLLFVIGMTLSLIQSGPYLYKSLAALFLKWFEYILIFLMSCSVFSKPHRIRNAVWVLIGVSLIIAIDGITQKIWGIEWLRHRHLCRTSLNVPTITGPFKHHNGFGAYLLVICTLIVGLLQQGKQHRWIRTILLLAGTLSAACLILTLSRGAWLGFFCALVCMAILLKRWKMLGIGIGLFFVICIFFLPVRERISFTFSGGSDARRFDIWRSAFAMIKEHPLLGKGVGTFMDYCTQYTSKDLGTQYAHNSFLQIWAETGIISLLSFVCFIGIILYQGIKTFFKNHDFLLLSVISAFFGFLVHSFFDNHLYSLSLAVLFWVLAGMLVALTKEEN